MFRAFSLRQTVPESDKKAYLSYLSTDNHHYFTNLPCWMGGPVPSWNAIRLRCRRKGVNMDMHLCRKIFASWLINKSGIDSITVDMLQGRCPPSVLARHYQVPDSQLGNRVLDAVSKLQTEIEKN